MSNLNTVRDGRLSHCYLLEKQATKVAAGSLKPGHFYVTFAKGASSALPSYPLKKPYYCTKTATVAEDDEVYELDALFLGYANNKNISMEKSTSDVTVDKDQETNYTCDGAVNVSGSINGMDLMDDNPDSGINKIRSRFSDIAIDDGDTVEFINADTTRKDLVAFIWDAKDARTGTNVAMDIIPGYLTSQSRDAAYQSGQTFDMDFQGCSSDDNGIERMYIQAKWAGIKSDVEDTTGAA